MRSIQLLKAKNIRFTQVKNPLDEVEKESIKIFWTTYFKGNAFLFNGNILAVENISIENDTSFIKYYESSYAHYLIKNHKKYNVQACNILYCSILLETTNNNIVLGKMSETTSSKGKILLPGGNIELLNGNLDLDICKHNAVRELKEEIGTEVNKNDLSIWRIKTKGENGNVGLFFKREQKFSEQSILNHFNHLGLNSENPELEKLYFVNKVNDFTSEEQLNFVDYVSSLFQEL